MRLTELYKQEIVPKMIEKFSYKNIMAVPKISKVTVNVGVGRHSKDKQYLENVVQDMMTITGQRPIKVSAKKSVSAFKVREGDVVGIMVSLHGQKMYDFVEKLVHLVFPRVRDFRGISIKKVDQRGNLSIGFKEHIAFPEIEVDKVDQTYSLEVNITTTAKTREEGLELFKLIGFPFKK